tara:strand:+ start:2672 stop:3049 length:378 start_codon:yes stop_codon:yes gene_type:complete
MYKEDTEKIRQMLEEQNYVADSAIVMSVYLAKTLQKPLLVEGPAGVGKTEIAKVMAKAFDTDLIRLQCYEGLDANMALYEWNYQRQLLHIKLEEGGRKISGRAGVYNFQRRFFAETSVTAGDHAS